jgi:chromosome partitioning protein
VAGYLAAQPRGSPGVDGLGLPVLGFLRDTQNYVHLAARGLTLFDVPPGRVEKDLAQWEAICRWLDTP